MEPTGADASSAVPLPADTVGKVKVRLSASGEASKGDDSGSQGGQQAMTSGERADKAAKKAALARDDVTSADTSDRKPSFTSAETTAAAAPAPSAAPASTSPAESGSSYSGSSYSGSSYTPQTSYPRSEWSTGLNTGPTAAGASTVTASTPSPDPAGSPPSNGYSSSRFSSGTGSAGAAAAGTASAIGGAAAGLANSVSAAWQKRGSAPKAPKGIQTRRSTRRQAMLTLSRVEPWSVMKFSFVASVVAFIILFVAVAVLYIVLAALGVFDSIQHTVTTMTSAQGSAGTNISHWTSPSLILGYTAMLGALNIVLITAMATVGSVIYNLIAKTIGGIEVTLRETD